MQAANERLTWDATYNGLPLNSSAYKVHLLILQAYRVGRVPQAPPEYPEIAFDQARIAIAQAGIAHCPTCASGGTTGFHWCEYKLTRYGEIYAGQRGAKIVDWKEGQT
jgi:hypothetical protein